MNESIHLLTGAYAVDALDPDERAEFEGHLDGCADCRDELTGLIETAARLGSAAAITPPASLKAAVLGQIDSVRQLPPLVAEASDAAVSRGSASAGEAGSPRIAPVIPLGVRRTNRILAVAAAFLGLAAASLGVLLASSHARSDELAARTQSVALVLTAPDAKTVTGDIAGGGRGAVIVSTGQGAAVLVATALPSPPSGRTYEMWFIDAAGKAQPAGTFVPDSSGSAAQRLTGTPEGSAVVGVTVEPAGGSSQPTTKPILAVPLA